MTQFHLHTFDDVPKELVLKFLSEAFNEQKARFLVDHGDWWHRHSATRFFVTNDAGAVVAYNSLIQSTVWIDDQAEDILWWIDLIVLPESRGMGVQRLIDEQVRALNQLRLGFPNKVARNIHARHGWGVRVDGHRWQYTLSLRAFDSIRYRSGFKGKILRGFAHIVDPIYRFVQSTRINRTPPTDVRELKNPAADQLAAIFEQHQPREGWITSFRDAAFIEWRYLQAPYRNELRFYVTGNSDTPHLAMITRTTVIKGLRTLRILDIFGNVTRLDEIASLIDAAFREALHQRAEHVLIVTTLSELGPLLYNKGLKLHDEVAFCWYSDDAEKMAEVEACKPHWVFADSDLDYSS